MGSACNDPAMAAFIMIFKNIMTVFQIIVPIILIVSAVISVGKMVILPNTFDERDPHGQRPDRVVPRVILHKFLAAVIVFFVPWMVNFTVSTAVSVMDSSNSASGFSFGDCWNAASSGQGIIQWVPGGQDVDNG